MQLVVGRVGRAHGIAGELAVVPHTDDPDSRLVAGAVLDTDPAERGPLRITGTRWHSGRLLVTFDGVADRTQAESLHGVLLTIDSTQLPGLPDDDEFYDHQLVGLVAVLQTGERVGTVAEVVHGAGPELLVVRRDDESEVLVPFVRQIVPAIDVTAGRLTLDPPEGLLEL